MNNIKQLRIKKGMTQEQLAILCGISRSAICKWENGVAEPNRENLIKLAKFYNVTTDYLLNVEQDTA